MGCLPNIVVNSHYHNDHIWGNQIFASNAQIISNTRTRELIATAGAEEFQWYSVNSAQRLETLQSQYQNTEDELQRHQLEMWMGYFSGLVQALPGLVIYMPGITFQTRLEIHGSKRTAVLISFEGAHTESDTVLYMPQEGIVFMSDLLFVRCHPYLADGNPLQLLKTLRELRQLDATSYIPGHGSIGTQEDLGLLIEYIEDCIEIAQALVKEGNYDNKIAELKAADQYKHWVLDQFFSANIRFLCQRLSSDKQES